MSGLKRCTKLLELVAAAVFCALMSGAPAGAAQFLPPKGKIWAGLSGGTSIERWQNLTKHHPPVFEDFMTWDTHTAWLANRNPGFRSRIAVHMSTAPGYGKPGVISTRDIALGHSDLFLIRMNHNLAHSGRVFYIRIMGEANGYWNPYCPYFKNGKPRPQSSTHDYIEAWRRTVLILRGGRLATIDKRLHALGLPRVRTKMKRRSVLPRPHVTFIWAPQTVGDPDIAGNQPADFWPGSAYVDWIGTDFYEGDNFSYLDQFYGRFDGKPFDLSEWAVIHKDDPSFVRAIFSWVRSHSRLRMFDYFQGFGSNSEANLQKYPNSAAVLRRELHTTKFPQYPHEYAHPPKPPHRKHHKRPPPPHPRHHGQPPNPPLLCINVLALKLCIPSP